MALSSDVNESPGFVYGPGVDEPLVQYEGPGTSDRRFLHADERGSIVAVSDSSGAVAAVNRYDDYGVPASANAGRFQYTGQVWIPEIGLHHYKARMYNPRLGRFMQTDTLGYIDGMNMYAYVGNDPVNNTDPSGMFSNDIVVIGDRCRFGWTCYKPGNQITGIAYPITEPYYFGEGDGGRSGYFRRVRPSSPAKEGVEGEIVVTSSYVWEPSPWAFDLGWSLRESTQRVFGRRSGAKNTRSPLREDLKQYNPSVNYCGGTGGPSLPNNIGGASFNGACYTHDVCYSASGASKSQCDINFGRDVAIAIGVGGVTKMPFLMIPPAAIVTSGLATIGVLVGGGKYYVPK